MTDYEEYLKKYATLHKISEKEAEQHQIVQEVKKQYNQKDDSTRMVGWKEV